MRHLHPVLSSRRLTAAGTLRCLYNGLSVIFFFFLPFVRQWGRPESLGGLGVLGAPRGAGGAWHAAHAHTILRAHVRTFTHAQVTVWDHTYMHAVVNAVLNTSDAPTWPGDRYDVWWILDLSNGEVWQYPHELLYGDTDDKPELIWKKS
jgi:hypothetical protein